MVKIALIYYDGFVNWRSPPKSNRLLLVLNVTRPKKIQNWSTTFGVILLTDKHIKAEKTSCTGATATICLRPLQVDSIFVFIRQVAPVPAYCLLRHQQQFDLWPFDLESGIRVTCDVGYLCANFSLPRPVCFDLSPMYAQTNVRQTDRRQTKASLNASALWGQRHNNFLGGGNNIQEEDLDGAFENMPKLFLTIIVTQCFTVIVRI